MRIIVIPLFWAALLFQMCDSFHKSVIPNGQYYGIATISFLKECSTIQENYFSQYDRSFLLKTKQFDSTKNRLAEKYMKLSDIYEKQDSIYLSKSQLIQILFHIDKKSVAEQTHENTIGHIEKEIQQWRWLLKYVEASSAESPIIDLVLPKQKNDCEYMSLVMADVLNELGIQTFREYTPLWQDRPKSHYWCVTTDSLGILQPFTPPENNLREDWESDLKYAGKVYRIECRKNRNTPRRLAKKGEYLPEVFRSDMITDQTDRYHKTSTIRIPLRTQSNNRLAYLCFYDNNDDKLSPVGWGIINRAGDVVIFEHVPHNVLLFPAIYEKSQLSPIDNPFIVEDGGLLKWMNPYDTSDMILYRKYPEKRKLVKAAQNIIGASFLGGENENGPFDTLGIIEKLPVPYPQDVVFPNQHPYRYYKLTTTQRKPLNIAEIQLLAPMGRESIHQKPMEMPTFDDNEAVENNTWACLNGALLPTGNSVWDAIDGDVLSYTGSSDLVFYFEKPTLVTAIRYLPRNANNIVVKNNEYVLYYYDKGWIEFGACTATSNSIRFNDVPGNAVYLLSNTSDGKEELPFFYLNGKQVFINSSELNDKTLSISTMDFYPPIIVNCGM